MGSLRAVQFGGTRIEYELRESARRKTVNIAVEANARVVVTAPAGVDPARVDLVVRRKAPWIVEHQRVKREVEPPLAAREFVSGESYAYLGRSYRLRVVEGAALTGVRLTGGRLVASVAERGDAARSAVRAALVAWYRAHAAERFEERVGLWAERVGYGRPRMRVSEARKRWGSLGGDGLLRLNWRLVQCPMVVVDYVVVHELVHLRYAGHRRDFWRRVRRVLLDAEARRAQLRRLEPRMIW